MLELYYKRYTNTVQVADYVEWANHCLYLDVLEIKKLASMGMGEQLNLFEIEAMFAEAMKSIQMTPPSKEECLDDHFKRLHAQLLLPSENAMLIVQEIYHFAIEYELVEEQMNWQELSDMIDDFQDGDNHYGYTMAKINEMIIGHARRTWHSKGSKVTFKDFIGQQITAIDTEIHLIIQFEKGSITIECPWRIRNADVILFGGTDIQSNQGQWKTVKELLVGKTIEDVQLFEQCPFLIVQCDDLFLDVFHASSFFDGWTLTDEEDFYMFSMHGGVIG
ncbi:hypothetical protein [Bacillus suaedae]|uniref:Uncharacterized protein n=1 Tax=Halalkalibacter suaedae TaxID=2822140 RepID=A0A941ATS1_9BACI|nr:hypothetical protein [Bacillus suaedae]MBP3952544.1 hypothetical protein [Bacillus suaedae]